LKQTAIDQDPRLLCLDDVAGAGYFAASRPNESDLHRDVKLMILSPLKQARSLDFRPMGVRATKLMLVKTMKRDDYFHEPKSFARNPGSVQVGR
jgi:hypothetical protein